MTLADSAGAVCAFFNMPAGSGTATIESKTNFLGAVRAGQVRAAAALFITKALALMTIIWVPKSQAGDWLVPTMLKVRFSSAPANCSGSSSSVSASFSTRARG